MLGLRSILLLVALASPAAAAFDIAQPARVRVTVRDSAGQPIAAAAVETRSQDEDGREHVATASTDASGTVALIVKRPEPSRADRPDWTSSLRVGKSGFATWEPTLASALNLAPAAEVSRNIVLEREEITVIRFEQPDGSPLPHVRFTLRYDEVLRWNDFNLADERGEFRFSHGALSEPLRVFTGSFWTELQPGPLATVRLTRSQMEKVPVARWIDGRVLLSDGSPARGWTLGWNVTSVSGGVSAGGPVQYTERLFARETLSLPGDGSFRILTAENTLVVVSPSGMPFRFPINVQAWPDGPRNLTLRVPPTRRVHVGRLQYPDGTPAARVEIGVNQIRPESGAVAWTFSAGSSATGNIYGPTWGPASVPIVTAADGTYHLPLYPGAEAVHGVRPGQLGPDENLAANAVSTVARTPPPPGVAWKRVRVMFQDEHGAPVSILDERPGRLLYTIGARPAPPNARIVAFHDDAGPGAFVPAEIKSLEIEPTFPGEPSFRLNIPIGPDDDQVVRVTLTETQRLRPLTGLVLDPDGQPVSAVNVDAWVWVAPSLRLAPQRRAIGLRATTDAQGRFRFPAAPDAGELQLSRYASDGNAWDLPGWTLPVEFSRESRELVIRLARSGSVRVQLPAWLQADPPNTLALAASNARHEPNSLSFAFDSGTRTLFAPSVPPGSYLLQAHGSPLREEVGPMPVAIEAGRETSVELPLRDFYPFRPRPLVPAEVVVLRDGLPFAGATVTVVPIPTERAAQAEADTSDEQGRVRLRGEPGARITVQARVPGRWISWTTLEVAGPREGRIELQPAAD